MPRIVLGAGAGYATGTLLALALGILAGGLAGALILLTGRAGRKAFMAYGPYLAFGAFLGMLRLW